MAELQRAWAAGHGRGEYARREIFGKESVRHLLQKIDFQGVSTILYSKCCG